MEEIVEAEHASEKPQLTQSPRKPPLVRRAFRNRFGHLRAGWRLLLYTLVAFAVGKSISTVLKLFMANPSEAPFASWAHSVLWVIGTCGLIGGALILLRFFDRRPGELLGGRRRRLECRRAGR